MRLASTTCAVPPICRNACGWSWSNSFSLPRSSSTRTRASWDGATLAPRRNSSPNCRKEGGDMSRQCAHAPGGSSAGWRRRWKSTLLLAAILTYAILIRTYNIDEPWGRDLLGMNGAWHSIIARNFLQHGLIATKGAPVLNATQDSAGDWTVYLHHPPLLDWSIALSFMLFGIHECSARFVFLLAALGCIERVFTLARRLFSLEAAIGASFFMAAIPISAIYSMHVDFQGSMVLYFALAAFCAYERFVRMRSARHGFLVLACTTLCCLTDWPGF